MLDGIEWATRQVEVCVGVCFMGDSHWGKVPQKCERVIGHDGPHACQLRATEPVATLMWPAQSDEAGAMSETCTALYRTHGQEWRCQSAAGHAGKHFSIIDWDGELQDTEWKDSDRGAVPPESVGGNEP